MVLDDNYVEKSVKVKYSLRNHLATTSAGISRLAPRRGRPRKFIGPSRPVTLTLPEHVIDALIAVDADLSRAIVRLAQPVLGGRQHGPAELVTFGRYSVIAVQPSKTLEKRTGVNLLHLPDGRALISFDRSMTIPGLELLIADALEDRTLPKTDRAIFEAIADILKSSRRSENVVLLQRHVIVLETRRSAASPSRRNSK
jgi:hypothetical protein